MRGASRPLCNWRGGRIASQQPAVRPLSAFFYSVPEMWFAANGGSHPYLPRAFPLLMRSMDGACLSGLLCAH